MAIGLRKCSGSASCRIQDRGRSAQRPSRRDTWDGSDPPPGDGTVSAHQPTPLCRSGRQKGGGAPVLPKMPPIGTAEPRVGQQLQRAQQVRDKCPRTSKGRFRAHAPLCPMCAPLSARNALFCGQYQAPANRLPPVQSCHRSPQPPAAPVPFAFAPGSPESRVACDDGHNPIPDPSQTRFSPIQANWRACFFTISREFPPEGVSRDLSAEGQIRADRATSGRRGGNPARGTHSYGTRQTKAPGSAPEG